MPHGFRSGSGRILEENAMVRRRVWFTLVLLLLCPVGYAIEKHEEVDIDPSQPLSLEQCIELALENSSDMQHGRLNLALQDLRVTDARAQYLPEISFNGQYSFSDDIAFGLNRQNYNLGVTGRYTLWDHGQRAAKYLRTKKRRKETGSQNERIRQHLIFQITQAYYAVLKGEELVKVSREILERSRENTAATRVHVEVGNLIPADIATSQVREANDELNLLSNENDLKMSKTILPRLMGLKPGMSISLVRDTDYEKYREEIGIQIMGRSVDEAIQVAFENRPEFKEINAVLSQIDSDLAVAKLNRWPQLDADFSYKVNLHDYLHEREHFNEYRSWDFTTRLNFPIFDGGFARRRVREGELLLEKTREDAMELERSIALEVWQAYLSLNRAERAIEISGTQVRNAAASLEVIRGRFEQELAFLLELLDAQTRYAQAMTNQVRSFYDYRIACSALQRTMGTLK